MKKKILAMLLLASTASAFAQVRKHQLFTDGWSFKLDSTVDYSKGNLNFSNWRKLQLPHDWSIELPFDKDCPTGNGGGALRGGMGWYAKTFALPVADKNKNITITFDGVYCNSEVWINGHYLGIRPNGYISFQYNVSPYLKFGTEKNTILVKVNNLQQPNSRWYSGSGIYRNVWITTTAPQHIEYNGSFVTTPLVTNKKATIQLQLTLAQLPAGNVTAQTKVYNKKNQVVANAISSLKEIANHQTLEVTLPIFWSVDNPYLYKAVTQLFQDGKLIDEYETSFGIRTFYFDAKKGFFLNKQPLKIRGVCNHHDLGCLGTAINKTALERQLRILKNMGCNAIRTSHNPPTPELLTLCDEMGFLVMDEAFDMWEKEKTIYDYHLAFNQWSITDIQDMVKRDRNHPSVIIWSLGNEIYEQWSDEKDKRPLEILTGLYNAVRALDTTRPTVTGNNFTEGWNRLIKPGITELVGYNYHHEEWKEDVIDKWKGKPFIVTESVSALQTRGHYDMPSDSIRRWPIKWDVPLTNANSDTTCSAYENCSTPWGTTHEETLKIFEAANHISGMFIWTGFDYMGEPTPYPWPARSSYFGIVDLAGFPKDCYYLYQSLWTNKTVLHLFPHWNWNNGQMVDMWAYYNHADEAELFINGVSQGVKKKQGNELHVMWRVKFEPGIVKVITRNKGVVVATKQIATAGEPYKIILETDRQKMVCSKNELAFVTAKLVDKAGNIVPNTNNLIQFTTNDIATVTATDNGLQTDLTPFASTSRKAWNGLCLAVIKANANGSKGIIKVKATAQGLQAGEVLINLQ